MNKIELNWNKARSIIDDADVLLFRGSGWYSKWIKFASRGEYTHAAIAGWCSDFLECLEFREWKGGRATSLRHEVDAMPGEIDVFRLSHYASMIHYDPVLDKIITDRVELSSTCKRDIVREMREMLGLDYGWKRIWEMAKQRLPLARFFFLPSYDDKAESPSDIYPVCSTAVVGAIRKHYIDVVPNLSDFEVTPSDLARASHLNYLFTLVP